MLNSFLKHFCFGILVAAAVFPWSSYAAGNEHDHHLLEKSVSQSYASVFDEAYRYTPETLNGQARKQQADSYERIGQRWVSGRPRAVFNYIDDGLLTNNGQTEFEGGIEFELMRKGARHDAQKLGRSYSQQLESWTASSQLSAAGQLRTTLFLLQERETLLQQAQLANQDAQQLLDIAEAKFKSGAISRESVLQARALLLEYEKEALEAEAALVDAERQYTHLTGLHSRPQENYAEIQVGIDDILPSHPLLRFLQSSIDVAFEQVNKTKQEAKGGPTISLGMRQDRGTDAQDYAKSLGVGFSIPFGGDKYVSTKTSDANRLKVDAEVQYKLAYRQLKQGFHEVEHEQYINKAAIDLSRQQTELSKQRLEMANKAYEAGETTMTQLVLAMQHYRNVEIEYQLLLIKQKMLISEFNQAVGSLP